MARQKGSANFAGTLEVLAGGPLDARTRVPVKADLTASGQFPYPYVGLECYVVAENKKYRLIADDPTDPDNWEEVGSGGTGLPSGGTQGQVLTKQSDTDGDADWDDIPHDNTKANSSSLAPVETSTTSEHAYTVGDHLMLAGGRFLVTADIAVGDTLDVSTNIQAVSIEDETGLSQADFADIITPLPGKFMGGLNYSLEEQVIGTWIDGKPIYQKTFTELSVTVNTGSWTNHVVTIPNGETLISFKAYNVESNGSVEITHAMDIDGIYIPNGDVNVLSFSGAQNRQINIVTVQYTKTTDPTP